MSEYYFKAGNVFSVNKLYDKTGWNVSLGILSPGTFTQHLTTDFNRKYAIFSGGISTRKVLKESFHRVQGGSKILLHISGFFVLWEKVFIWVVWYIHRETLCSKLFITFFLWTLSNKLQSNHKWFFERLFFVLVTSLRTFLILFTRCSWLLI